MLQFIKENKKFSIVITIVFILFLTAAFGLAVGSAVILGVSLLLAIPATVSLM
jgi:hypothetical protein